MTPDPYASPASDRGPGLSDLLRSLDGRSYGAYKKLRGSRFELPFGRLRFLHVQGDPFAAPTRIQIELQPAAAALPEFAFGSPVARRASADFLQRDLLTRLGRNHGRPRSGSGKSGLMEMAALGPEVLERSGVQLADTGACVVRLSVGLPAAGRRILGLRADELLCDRLPALIEAVFSELDAESLRVHVNTVEDQVALRAALVEAGLVGFLADGSCLPRRSGAEREPLEGAIPLRAPDSLAVELRAPNAGPLRGLGIPEGVSLIVGGGYHGKSTLLAAIQASVYDHCPGDGRENCVARAEAVSVRAEDGRAVAAVDLRPFIGKLPLGVETSRFCSQDASGSTSQAASIVEALEAGATGLLIDEDTAATNFLIRDARMRRLIPEADEPITPFLDRVRQLWDEQHVSSVLVLGGAGDYLDVADTVIQMSSYRPVDLRERAQAVAAELPLGEARPRAPGPWPTPVARVPDPASLNPERGRRAERVRSVRTRTIEFGRDEIDVSLLPQLVDASQCRAVGDAILELSRGLCDGRASVCELLDELDRRLDSDGIDAVFARDFGDRARPRRFEIAAALNRLRSLVCLDD